jgi:tetratricopeptide (TPR) repeat protein
VLKTAPKLGKSADAGRIALTLQDAWRAFHRGDFEEADALGTSLGAIGLPVANKAMGIHTAYLVANEKERLARYETIAARADEAIAAMPDEANAHYLRAFALGRYSQLLSITKALAQGLAGKVKDSLDATLKLAPKHAEAHLAMALYHAEIVGKVGGMLASLTYGAKPAVAEKHLETAAKLAPDSPVVHLERGNALLLLYGDQREDDAAEAYAKAAASKPRDAMEALDAAEAKAQIE